MWNANLPGGFDKLNLYTGLYPSDSAYGIPTLLRDVGEAPKDLVSWKNVTKPKKEDLDKCVHFFLDDYHFEGIWNSPKKTLSRVQKIGTALTPDYSVFLDMPRALQIFNVYRNRWIGRYWQENGVRVIPTVSWGNKKTYDFCFDGIEKNNPVAVSTVGILKADYSFFIEGFEAMIDRLDPSYIMMYGEKTIVDDSKYNIVKYDSYWAKTRKVI